MDKIANTFLLAELHLRELAFTQSAGRLFTKHRERIQKFR